MKRHLILYLVLACLALSGIGLFVQLFASDVQKVDAVRALAPSVLGYQDEHITGTWATLVYRATTHPFHLVTFIIFVLAIVHTFCAHFFTQIADNMQAEFVRKLAQEGVTYDPKKHVCLGAELLHFLGEVEVIFALWVIPLVIAITVTYDWKTAITYLGTRDYREPLLVIVIMALASTRPILQVADDCIHMFARIGGSTPGAWWLSLLTVGPFLGSIVTEPGAMTITASLLARQFFAHRPSTTFAYATLGLLFVNISTGGDLTHFAAPPVLIVSRTWGWGTPFVFTHFGWKSIVAVFVSNIIYFLIFRKELGRLKEKESFEKAAIPPRPQSIPLWITFTHLLALGLIVWSGHQPVVFLGLFLIFLAFYQATIPHQSRLNLRAPLLVGLFLMGLVIHGGLQGWWISPLLAGVQCLPLMFLAIGLTSVNDNASITYLSSLTPHLSASQKYAVVAGAITGGGLTVIANAPNPAGQQILNPHFKGGISPWRLFVGALIPTLIVALCFILLDSNHIFPCT